ncbi:hypothetical protein BDY17DRAFT_100999 [Neohortaea acidophila]|uniref:Uncharacterized protein n=1 Tax=Neohortaea acidophila TaxID=245834 RepID=A0A6A6Q1M0_9PEZI|nr:uncharacterized protein BDY17DRAFT_100999 [Neohortaea acidophila]KAF2485337.1 hypothetical protein BDY17DRAFT_100999 [Neohortaea acidophila]
MLSSFPIRSSVFFSCFCPYSLNRLVNTLPQSLIPVTLCFFPRNVAEAASPSSTVAMDQQKFKPSSAFRNPSARRPNGLGVHGNQIQPTPGAAALMTSIIPAPPPAALYPRPAQAPPANSNLIMPHQERSSYLATIGELKKQCHRNAGQRAAARANPATAYTAPTRYQRCAP